MVERYYGVKDDIQDDMVGTLNGSATIVTYTTSGKFSGIDLPFIITVSLEDDTEKEKMKVTAVDDGLKQLTVVRGFQGTGISHSTASKIALRAVAEHIQDLTDTAVMLLQENCYLEKTTNGTNQITIVDVWETSAKTKKLITSTFTYPDTATLQPTTVVRQIFRDDGTTVRKTETTTLTWTNESLTTLERVIT